MRWIAIAGLLLFISGCRGIGNPCHHQTQKPIEVGLSLSYNLPNGQGQVNMEVRR